MPRPVPAIQMIGRHLLPPTIGSSIITVKPTAVPIPPKNSLFLFKVPGSHILTPKPSLLYA